MTAVAVPGCTGKRTWTSKREAKLHARQTQSLGDGQKVGRIQVYRCDHCDRFHIGHPAGTWRPRERGGVSPS